VRQLALCVRGALLVARVVEHHPHLAELVPQRLRAVAEAEEGHPLETE
jgi:hypothetical protein